MNKKKIVTVCLVVALLAVCAIGGSLAYFTDTDNATNTFTVGNVDIQLTEPSWNPAVSHIADPGVAVAKDPVVTNVGANDAWIRVNVTISDATAFSTAMNKHGLNDLGEIFGNHDESKWTLASKGNIVNDTLTYSYYYYRPLLAKDGDNVDATEALFDSVTIPAEFTSADMEAIGSDFTITVKADAIQANGFTNVADAFKAFDAQVK